MTLAYDIKSTALYNLERFAEALTVARKSAELYEEYFGNTHPKIHVLYQRMGDCCIRLDNPVGAKEHYEKALQSAERVYAADSEVIAAIKSKLTS